MPPVAYSSPTVSVSEGGKRFTSHLPIVLLLLLALIPLFTNLGGDHLWSDEGDTAVLALSILKHGVPKAWDGTTFTDSDFGQRVNKDLIMVSHPWVQYYVAAASFALLGETPFAARLPFAIAGLLTIAATYLLVIKLTGQRRAAFSASILLILSVQFLLFSRECRNYALTMFLTILLLLLFLRLSRGRDAIWFSLTGILLFHSHPSAVAPLAALGALTLFYKPMHQYRKWYWISAPVIALFTVPWLFLAKAGYEQNSSVLPGIPRLPSRAAQFFFEWSAITPVVGILAMLCFLWWRHRRETPKQLTVSRKKSAKSSVMAEPLFTSGEQTLLVLIGSVLTGYALLLVLSQSQIEMYNYGLRQAAAIVPLMMALGGFLVTKICRRNRVVWICLMLILSGTKLGRIGPWTFLQDETVFEDPGSAIMHEPRGWVNKIFNSSLIAFHRELFRKNPGTVAGISAFLKTNAAPNDVLITNYAWEPVYFHSRLPQGIKILPSYPIYETARKHGLPEYTFTVQGTRWVVWRWAWQGYRDYDWNQVYDALIQSGAKVEKVATIPETTWENRPNIHFRRFPDDDYKYRWYGAQNQPDAEIFRVDWPSAPDQQSAVSQETTQRAQEGY